MMTDPFYYPIYDEAERLGIPITVHLANGSPDLFRLMTNEAGGGAFAYVADVTPPEERAARFGMLGAAFGIVLAALEDALRETLATRVRLVGTERAGRIEIVYTSAEDLERLTELITARRA